MRVLKWGCLEGLSPLGALVAGVVIGTAGLPVIKKGLRGLAFTATKAVIAVTDQVKEAGECLGQEWKQIVSEVSSKREEKKDCVRAGLRGAGVGVVGAGIGIAEQARDKMQGIKEGWRDLVEEARSERNEPEAGIDTTGTPPPAAVSGRVRKTGKIYSEKAEKSSNESDKDDI